MISIEIEMMLHKINKCFTDGAEMMLPTGRPAEEDKSTKKTKSTHTKSDEMFLASNRWEFDFTLNGR